MKTNVYGAGGVLLAFSLALTGCATDGSTGNPTSSTPTAAADLTSTPIDGTYSVTWVYEELYVALGGDDNPDAARDATNNMGEIQLILDGGEYDMRYVDLGDSCPGTFVVEGERVVMTATEDPSLWDCGDGLGQLLADAAWTVDDKTLTLTDWHLSPQPAMDWFAHVMIGTKPLTRLG